MSEERLRTQNANRRLPDSSRRWGVRKRSTRKVKTQTFDIFAVHTHSWSCSLTPLSPYPKMRFSEYPFKYRAGVREVARLIMPTLGEELRHKREQRGVSLAEISEATRIGTRFLKAIETDNFSILPGGIFTRSFIRAYAKHVGMNEDDAIGLYLQQVAGPSSEQQDSAGHSSAEQPSPEQPSKRPAPPRLVVQKPAPPPERSRRFEPVTFRQSTSRTSWPTVVIGAGILIFIVIIVIALVKQLNQGASESGSQATSVAQKNPPPRPAVPSNSQPAQQPSTPPAAKPDEHPSSMASEVPPGQPLVVKIEAATGDSWVSYQVDDSKPTSFTLKQGESRDVPPAQNQISLKYGNRTVLKLRINNHDARFPPDSPKFQSKVVISRDTLQTFSQ